MTGDRVIGRRTADDKKTVWVSCVDDKRDLAEAG